MFWCCRTVFFYNEYPIANPETRVNISAFASSPSAPAARQLAVLCLAGSALLAGAPAVAVPASPAASAPVLQTPLTQLRFRTAQAHLTHTVGDVKVNGQAVHAGVRLEESARISTGEDSSAVLVLADGSQVKLMPRTVAELTVNRYYLAPERPSGGRMMDWFAAKMRLAQGALEAAVNKVAPRAKPLEVETTTSLIGVRGTRFRVAAADPTARQDRAEVLQGVVNNENTWKRSAILLRQGQGAAVDPNHAEMAAVPLLPPAALGTPVNTLMQPGAVWTFPPIPDARAYRVIASSDAQFESVHLSEKLAGNAVSLDGLTPGIWHIRVRGVDAYGLEGQDADTQVVVRAPDSLLLNPSLYVQPAGLTLRWSAVNFRQVRPSPAAPSTVAVSVFSDAALTQSVGIDSSGQHGELKLPALGPGTYYLQVTARNSALAQPEQQTYRVLLPANMGSLAYHVLLEQVPAS